jgi:hypothetical protein
MSLILIREEARSGESIPSSMPSVIMASQRPNKTSMISHDSAEHYFGHSHNNNDTEENEPEHQEWKGGMDEDTFSLGEDIMAIPTHDQWLPESHEGAEKMYTSAVAPPRPEIESAKVNAYGTTFKTYDLDALIAGDTTVTPEKVNTPTNMKGNQTELMEGQLVDLVSLTHKWG